MKNKIPILMALFSTALSMVVALVIYAVATHGESGFSSKAYKWNKKDFPLPVGIVNEDPKLSQLNREALRSAVSITNNRLGFQAFQISSAGAFWYERVRITVEFQVPYEKDKMEHSGLATCMQDFCRVQICNVGTLAGTVLALRHELGHVLGLAHDDFEDSLMYEGGLNENQQYRLTDYDRSIIRARYAP